MLRIVEYTARGLCRNQRTAYPFKDVAMAFDSVCQKGLLYKAGQMGCLTSILKMIYWYLKDRRIRERDRLRPQRNRSCGVHCNSPSTQQISGDKTTYSNTVRRRNSRKTILMSETCHQQTANKANVISELCGK